MHFWKLFSVIRRGKTTAHHQLLVLPSDVLGKLTPAIQAEHQTIKEYYARANALVEADFRLPERQKSDPCGVAAKATKNGFRRPQKQPKRRLPSPRPPTRNDYSRSSVVPLISWSESKPPRRRCDASSGALRPRSVR